jgi:hypothetical protein
MREMHELAWEKATISTFLDSQTFKEKGFLDFYKKKIKNKKNNNNI